MLELLVEGERNKDIAKRLGIGELVVKNYLKEIYQFTKTKHRTALALWWLEGKHETNASGIPIDWKSWRRLRQAQTNLQGY